MKQNFKIIPERFLGKNIIITGGTSGMGLVGAKRIADEGGKICITGNSQKHIEEASHRLPSDALIVKNDASLPYSAIELAEQVKQMGGIDGLWLNAGLADICAIENVEADFFDHMMNVNVRGIILQIAQLSKFLNNGASVVLTSSTSAYEGAPMASVYAATKGAIISLSRCLASELASRNIRVNTLIPGAINTNFRNFMPDDLKKTFESHVVSQVPLGRVGTAEEAAAVALFLLSDESSYVTGSQYAVDGGLIMQ